MPERTERTENNLAKIRDVDFEMRPPFANAKWNGEPEFQDALKLEIASGDTTRYEFVEKPSNDIKKLTEGLIEFTKIGSSGKSDQKISINMCYIVSVEEITIVSRNYLITEPTKGPNFGTISLSYPAGTKNVKFSKDI